MCDGTSFIACTIKQLQGDAMIVAAETAIEVNPVNRPILLNRVEAVGIDMEDKLLISVLTDRKWHSKGVHLSVSFMDSPSADLRARILAHMNAWGDNAKVRFSETNGTGEIRIAREIDGHWSYLGTDILTIDESEPTMNLQAFSMNMPESEFRRVVRHETGHSLGFPHEHLRRELVERLVVEKVVDFYAARYGWDEAQTRAQVLTPIADSAIEGMPDADADSIMCYEVPGTLTMDGKPIRGGKDINARDAALAAACYPGVI